MTAPMPHHRSGHGARHERRAAPAGARGWTSRLKGREQVSARLAELAARPDIVLLEQRRMPFGRGAFDLIAVGPGGVTVAGALLLRGRMTVTGGGAHDPARLLVGGRDHTSVVAELEQRVNLVRRELSAGWRPAPPVRGALCVPGDWELAPFATLELHGVLVDGAETIARLIRRQGVLTPAAVARTAERLRLAFPSAGPRRYAA